MRMIFLICVMYISLVIAVKSLLSNLRFLNFASSGGEGVAALGLVNWFFNFFIIVPTIIVGIISSVLTALREKKSKSIHFFLSLIISVGEFTYLIFLLIT